MPSRKPTLIADWFRARYGKPTPAQKAAWPLIKAGHNILLASPTGTGKTFAAFFSVLEALSAEHLAGKLPQSIQCIYVSPLRALGYDLEKNLRLPLHEIFGEKGPIRVDLRTGDTGSSQRQTQFRRPPHILLTTPESLCLLLSQEKWLPLLATVRWLIIDEIHAMAESKRGAHLALSVERLDQLHAEQTGSRMQRIGLSATIAPLTEAARFLAGTDGPCRIVDVASKKRVELSVHTPLRKEPYPEAGYTGQRLIGELGSLIEKHQTTLIFCNVRSGAEAVTYWLRERFPALASEIECHHASLEREVRREVEDRLKRGELRAVVCSTSLELGIDIGAVELVVMMSTPKGVTKALQRAGRAGHNVHAVSRGILMATNMSDLVESCATVLLARQRHLEAIRLVENPLDVLAQHLVSMGCTRRWSRTEALSLIRRAYPFHQLSLSDFDDTLQYLAGGGVSLQTQYRELFGKIELEPDFFQTRGGRVRRDFLQNVGVIPSVASVTVRTKARVLGSVEEMFIRQLRIGDVFTLAGRPVRLERLSQMEARVSPASGSLPTVPRWNASKMPLSNRVAEEIMAFRQELRRRLEDNFPNLPEWIAQRLDCGSANAGIILKMHAAQHLLSEIPTADFLLVEELAPSEPLAKASRASKQARSSSRLYFFHSLIGRSANDALARVISYRLSLLRGGNAIATPHDYGFVLCVANAQHFSEAELADLLRPENFEEELQGTLTQSEMLKYHFRNAAQTGLMVYRNFFDQAKPVRKLAWSAEVIFNVLQQHEPNHVLLREARHDTLRSFVDPAGARNFLEAQANRPVRLRRLERIPPLSFGMYATQIKEALLVEDPAETMERLYHQWWQEIETHTALPV